MPPLLTLLLALALQDAAPSAPPPPAPPKIDCQDQAHRAIGFWVGRWTVIDTASGTPVAESRIEWILGGCAIRETYDQATGPGGVKVDYHGSSQSALDAATGQWRQFYIDNTGNTSSLAGTLQGQRLVMQAEKSGGLNRMTIERLPDGNVRQRGDRSTDGGKTWSPGYDFTYARKQ